MRKRRKFKSICCLFILALLLLSSCGAAETAKETAGGSTPPAVSNAHEDAELEYAYFSETLRPFGEGFDVCGVARLDGERLAVLGADADSAKLLILSYAPGESGRPEFSELASTQPETPAIDDTHRLNVFLTLGGDGYLYLLAVAPSTIWENNAYAEYGTHCHSILERWAKGELMAFELAEAYENGTMDQLTGTAADYRDYIDSGLTAYKYMFGPVDSCFNFVADTYPDIIEWNAYTGAPTPSWVDHWGTLQELIDTTYLQIIQGTLDLDTGFDQMVQQWNDLGGADITEEVNEIVASYSE